MQPKEYSIKCNYSSNINMKDKDNMVCCNMLIIILNYQGVG